MTTMSQSETAQGLMLHRAGDLSGAARLYESALARDPGDADATCLLGVVRQEQGRVEEALVSIGRAVALRPDSPAYHASLGLALQSMGRSAEAAEAFARVLALNPDDAAAHVNRGVIVRGLGDRDAALDHFRRAVTIDPQLLQARMNLGEILLELGRPDMALAHGQAATALAPGLVEPHLTLGNIFLALGREPEGRACYIRAYELDRDRARTAAALGLAAVRRGDISEAHVWFRGAVAREPGSVEFLRYLAEVAGILELYHEVKSCCERILAIDPDQAVAHNALAWVLQRDDRHDEARRHYETAIRLEPSFATAHFNLGVLHEDLGEMAEAEGCYRRALECDPTNATAMARLGDLLRESTSEADLAAMRRMLDEAGLIGRDRANLLFALALVRDGRREYREAAACLAEANAMALEANVRGGPAYSPEDHRRFVDRMIAGFDAPLFERMFGAGLGTRRPVFIIGMPRSGTTLIEQVLASHPEVHGAGEVSFSRSSFEALSALIGHGGDPMEALAILDASMLGTLALCHEENLSGLDGGRARRVISKMPEDYFYLGLIALMFPHAVVIHCRRDLRDVALSCWMTNFVKVPWANDPDHIASRIAGYCRLMDHWRTVLPASFAMHEVDYEDAVADLEGVSRRLLAAIGLDWDPACREFHRTRRPVKTASQVQVRKPVYRGSVGRWEHYRDELAGLFERVEAQAGIRSDRHAAR